jgi:hypothetical protein
MDEQENPAAPGPPGRPGPAESPESGATVPVTAPTAGPPESRRGEGVRRALTSRGAGWVVATAMTGAVVALSVVLATQSPALVVGQGVARSVVLGPAFGGPPFGGPACLQVPANARASVSLHKGQVEIVTPGGSWVLAPASVHVVAPGGMVEVPANGKIPARLLAPGCMMWLPGGRVVQIPAPAASPRSSLVSPSPSAS